MEYITKDLWPSLADHCIQTDADIESIPQKDCIIHCLGAMTPKVFEKIETLENEYVLITSGDNAGPIYYPSCPISKINELFATRFNRSANENHNRYDDKYCKASEIYLIKDYFYAYGTFRDIPKNIKQWFSTHCNIRHNRIMCIPVGVDKQFLDIADIVLQTGFTGNCQNKNTYYVNFKDTTNHREKLLQEVSGRQGYTRRHNLSTREYIKDILNHQYILTPPGVGLDTSRILEVLYLGRTPIVENNLVNIFYREYPQVGYSYIRSKIDAYFWRKVINNYKTWFENKDIWNTTTKK